MTIKKLPVEIQSIFNAAAKINNYKNAVEELVYNAIDADATSIAIRIHIHESFIQVIDNGCGIHKSDIPLLGLRYTSSKVDDISMFKSAPNKYGFHGEALSNIIEVSHSVKITTRCENTKETWVKIFCNGQHKDSYTTIMRPSKGTTIEIKGFLYNLHIQEKSINALSELENIKLLLQQVSLVRTNVSISLRDNSKNEIIFKIQKNRDIYQTLSSLFGINKNDIQELQVEKNKYKAIAFIGKKDLESNLYKWIYLNGKFVFKSELHDIINTYFVKSDTFSKIRKNFSIQTGKEVRSNAKENIPFYFIFISCPHFDYDISFTSKNTILEFKDWNQIKKLMEKLANFYNGDINLRKTALNKPNKIKKLENTEIQRRKQNTREEVKNIMEKILGNKSKKLIISQMHKGVKGKPIRKKNNFEVKSDNKQTKNSHTKEIKYNKSELNLQSNSKTLQLKENTHTSEYSRIDKAESSEHYPCNKKPQGVKKKIQKTSKVKNRNKYRHYVDPLIKKFYEETASVKHRCNLYSENIKEALMKKVGHELVHCTNRKWNNKDLQLERKHNIVSNEYIPHSQHFNNNDGVIPLNKANKQYLRSYDLVKTILGSQNQYNYRINKENNKSEDLCFNNYKSNTTYKYSYNTESRFFTTDKVTMPKLTFESHTYYKDNIDVLKNNKHIQQYISERSKDNCDLPNKITQSMMKVTAKCKNKMSKKPKSHFHLQSKLANTKPNILKNHANSLRRDIYYTHQSSHIIEFSETNDNIKKIQNENFNTVFKNNACIEGRNYKVTGNIHSTYTIIDSNVSLDIDNYVKNVTKNRSEYQDSPISTCHKDIVLSSIHQSSDNHGNNLKVIFISNSENLESQKTSNRSIDPLSFCTTVYQNPDVNRSDMNNNIDMHKDEILYDTEAHLNFHNKSSTPYNVNDLLYMNNEMGQISHHFANFNKDKNSYCNLINNCSINNEQRNCEGQEVNNLSNQDKNQDLSIDNTKNCITTVDNIDDNGYNNFKLQNRHRFVPKGMSPIFENCLSRNVCSYDLQMDYFEDELYHNFAEDVLVNYKTFENRVQDTRDSDTKDAARTNNRLKKDNPYLTFNTLSLKNAKVFGQVDNKFIAAEIQSDTSNTLKYLVLFDQHAVHERIRLEKNLSDYIIGDKWISTKCEDLFLKLAKDNIIYLNNYKDKFIQLGLDWKVQSDCEIIVNAIPKALFGRHLRQPEIILDSVRNLILEQIKAIKLLSGNTLLYPKSIMELIFSEVKI
ncbi:unnamed protein product [Parnassius apollo]|uniref:(apollo) hypothetical protein n=1 Tax=Parnassius apollo TaxID=110799 RepID=A0A8S3XYX8_PARAO|nr:unnamed protein product [Parnassius apollo]